MNNIILKNNEIPDIKELYTIYNDAGWTNYTNDLDNLLKAYYNSLSVITAWKDNELVGILRAVGDGCTIIYIQDIIVKENFHRKGIGKLLINELMNEYKNVRQKVLLTENQPNTLAFYKSCGFLPVDKYDHVSFINYNFE